jgi:AcrR family transcriptional regulator
MSQNADHKEIRENLIRDTKRGLILDAAIQIFSEKGFHETKLEEIAQKAGFSKASLYNYYEDKESIFLHLAIREHEKILEALPVIVNSTSPIDVRLREMLHKIFSALGKHFSFLLTVSNFQAMVGFCDMHGKSSGQRSDLMQLFKETGIRTNSLMETLIASGQNQGVINQELEPAKLSRFVGALIRGVVFEWRIAGEMGDIDKEIDSMMKFILKGFSV